MPKINQLREIDLPLLDSRKVSNASLLARSVLLTFAIVFVFTYGHTYPIFLASVIASLAILLAIRVVDYIVLGEYYFLLGICYWINLLTIFNFFFPQNQFLVFFGAWESVFIALPIPMFGLRLNFQSLRHFTNYYIHIVPALYYLPMIQDGTIDFNRMDFCYYFPRAMLIMASYYIIQYFLTFYVTYNHWNSRNIGNFYSAYKNTFPMNYLISGESDKKDGITFFLFYFSNHFFATIIVYLAKDLKWFINLFVATCAWSGIYAYMKRK